MNPILGSILTVLAMINLYLSQPEVAESLLADLTADVQNGRSADGPEARNDIENINLWKSRRMKDAEFKR
jgi:hypothetical protein